ncbi:MAG: glycosyltransferase family 39 protein [Bacteroidales bacterium]|nr:glycosyltransferase family 39 protein [Bacteroidales bacterium]
MTEHIKTLDENTSRRDVGLWLILGIWFIINMLQASLSGLMDDEALFWMYGEHLTWGFYEHPPMVAFLIKSGYSLLHNAAGVRILFVLTSTLTVFLIARISNTKNWLLFAALLFSTLIANAGGFLAAPDGPLLLFTALFFLFYQRFLEKENVAWALLLGLAMAGLIYSKYNGILVIIFTMLSNFKLLTRKRFYLAIVTGVILFLPHILWQFYYDFPTIRYHLVDRNIHEHDFLAYFGEYIIGQLGIYGPLMAIFFFWMTFSFKTESPFDRSLKFTAIGILLFFLLYSFRGRIEPNWTLPAFIPMMVLTIRSLANRKRLLRIVYPLAAISIVLIFAFRIYIIHDFLHLPRKLVNLTEFQREGEWADTIAKKAGDHPVLFLNSYQNASKYIYYTGRLAFDVCDYDNHATQFNYWNDLIRAFQGKTVMVVDNNFWRNMPGQQALKFPSGDSLCYSFIHDFSSYSTIPVVVTTEPLRFQTGQELDLPVTLLNPEDHTVRFDRNPDQPTFLVYSIHQGKKRIASEQPGPEITSIELPVTGYDTVLHIVTPETPGRYELYVSLKTGWLPAGQNGKRLMMEIY